MLNRKRVKDTIEHNFENLKVLVIGDIMIDEYVTGEVKRISPEAPIPILNYSKVDRIAGGASNVAHNIVELGADVTIAGVIGEDEEGEWLKQHLQMKGIDTSYVINELSRPTTVKRRFATKNQQLLRVDIEKSINIDSSTEEKILQSLKEESGKYDAVILSDYQKGVLGSKEFIKKIIELCNETNMIITVDSKTSSIDAFEDATFVKPNNLELEEAVGIKIEDESTLDKAGRAYLCKSKAKALMVTRGAKGISLFRKDMERLDFPSKAIQVYDVTGAGDTVISVVTLGIAAGLSMEESIELGNSAASIVISKVGTVPVNATELMEKIHER